MTTDQLAQIKARLSIQYHGLTYGDNLSDIAALIDEVERLEAKLAKAKAALRTLSIAVNDKVEDKGATNFCLRVLAEIGEKE